MKKCKLYANRIKFFCFLDAYVKHQLDYKWSGGNKADKIRVQDKHLSQLSQIHTEALKGFEYYTDGKQ